MRDMGDHPNVIKLRHFFYTYGDVNFLYLLINFYIGRRP